MLNKVILSLAFCVAVALAQSQWAFQEDGSDDRLQQNAEVNSSIAFPWAHIGQSQTYAQSHEYMQPIIV